MPQPDPVEAPAERYVRRRHVARKWQDWAHECDRIMLEHGEVQGSTTYRRRHQARWRAQRLIDLMVGLNLHARWELRERTWETPDGWAWAVEYRGRQGDG